MTERQFELPRKETNIFREERNNLISSWKFNPLLLHVKLRYKNNFGTVSIMVDKLFGT